MILLNSSRNGAFGASLKEFNGSGRFATIAANMELEWLMESEIGRMLAGHKYVTEDTEESEKPAVDCGRGKPYKSCTPPGNNRKVPEPCSTYKRGCPTS
ncbi:hypothetical protein COLO4_38000 [Corchorus olitorius]|uniref:Uncharacterized protein n=1 Tax=Corchorus olitorius TaxID=93759 RepID=A0A1R3FXK1_9ROSI|nr:hypothetical protein COLO4_38000 [Corchorus olitorius]